MALAVRRERPTSIEVWKGTEQRYHSDLHRRDGVRVRLEGGSYNRIGGPVGRIPHDIAHLVVEAGLGLESGLWGVLAAGGIVQNASFAEGRLPPHALRRATALTDGLGEQLRQAEVLVRAVADLSLSGGPTDPAALRRVVGERWWSDAITVASLTAVEHRLRDAAASWQRLAPGDRFEMTWGTVAPGDPSGTVGRRSAVARRPRR